MSCTIFFFPQKTCISRPYCIGIVNTVAIAKIGADSSAKTTPNAPKLIINIFSEDKRSAQTGQRTQLKELSSEEFTADLDDISSEKFTTVDNSFEEEIPEDISDEPEAEG